MGMPLDMRRAMLVAAPSTYVSGGASNVPLTAGSPVSPVQTVYPTCSGVQQYMLITVSGSVKNTHATDTATRTTFGAANLLQLMRYTDVSGYDRHQIDGRGLELLNAVRQYGLIAAANSYDTSYGVEFGNSLLDAMPPTIAAGVTSDFVHTFVVPFAYSATDQRGAIMANGVNVQQTVQLTFPTKSQAFVDPTANALGALYTITGGSAEFVTLGYQITTVTKNLNLPAELPIEDLSVYYILQGGARTGLAVGADFRVPYDSGRDYLNTVAVYDNGGVLNPGTDINSLSVMLGGSQDIYRAPPHVWAVMASLKVNQGLPKGTYYKNHTAYPINVARTGGSADFIINPSSVAANAVLWTYNDYLQIGALSV